MSNLLSTSQERVYFKDLMSRFLFVSEGWIEAYTPGRAAEELTGKTDFEVFTADHASAAFADEQEIIRTGVPLVGQVERETYSGRPDTWVSTTKMPLRDERGEILGTFGITRDITPQITAEHALARQARELSAQNERLRELDRLKDEFVALVSHELRTPLTSIHGYLNLVLEADGADLADEQRQFLSIASRNTDRLRKLVEDLLLVSELDAGELEFEFDTVDFRDLARESVESARPIALAGGISLELSARSAMRLNGDRVRLGQLLDNVISNALKFTPRGGRVSVRVTQANGSAVLEVEDTGIGIAADEQKHLFDRFFRGRAAGDRAIQGTGLGLSISQSIAKAHGGQIEVASEENGGTTFRFAFPRAG
jgi:two-component system, sensor histidine kinase and response regulator